MRGTKGVAGIQRRRRSSCKVTAEKKKILADNAVTGQGLPKFGTQVLMNVINEMGALPTRNHRDVQFEGANGHLRRGDARKRATDGKTQLRHQPGLLRLHHRLRPHLARWTRATSPSSTSRNTGAHRRPGIRGGLGAGRRQRRRRPRGAAVRQPALQRGRHGPDLLRRHRRRRDGAVRHGRADQGADRHRRAVRLGPGAGLLSPR